MILSTKAGIFEGLWFEDDFQKNNLLDVYCTYNKGDKVSAYQNTTHSLGTILFKAETMEEIIEITNNIEKYYKVVVS